MCLRSGSSILEEGASVSAQSLLTWVLTATTRLLPGHSQTLAVLVAAALRSERPNLAQVGRGLRASGRVALAVARQGSLRPVRARIRAYGSSTDRFATPEGSPWLSVRVPWTCG